MKIGIIGSRHYRNKENVIRWLEENIKEGDIIVSGRSPTYNFENVDCWAENWANERGIPTIIYPPKKYTREDFFKRNTKIAEESEKLVAFIPDGVYRSGAWNTVSKFKGPFTIVNEKGEEFVYLSRSDWIHGNPIHKIRP